MSRLPLIPPPESRDGTVDKDGLCKNLLVEQDEAIYAVVRPGLSTAATTTGNGNGLVEFNGRVLSAYSDSLNELTSGGSLASIATLDDRFFDFAQSVL